MVNHFIIVTIKYCTHTHSIRRVLDVPTAACVGTSDEY